jgi:hypothetical protein
MRSPSPKRTPVTPAGTAATAAASGTGHTVPVRRRNHAAVALV